VLLPVALSFGCAAGSRPAAALPDDPNTIPVTVENNLTPRTAVTVRITSASATRVVLGIVSPGRSRTLQFEESFFESGYQLIAETTEGQTITSRVFQLYPSWTLTHNTVAIGERGGE
jgi:hypothetical protein